jgi:hypothetical protein
MKTIAWLYINMHIQTHHNLHHHDMKTRGRSLWHIIAKQSGMRGEPFDTVAARGEAGSKPLFSMKGSYVQRTQTAELGDAMWMKEATPSRYLCGQISKSYDC